MLHPSYSELIDAVNKNVPEDEDPIVTSRYSIIHAVAKRARQLVSGEEPLVEADENRKALSVAVDELYSGAVQILRDNEPVEEQWESPMEERWLDDSEESFDETLIDTNDEEKEDTGEDWEDEDAWMDETDEEGSQAWPENSDEIPEDAWSDDEDEEDIDEIPEDL